METLKTAVSNLKANFVEFSEQNLIKKNYGISFCNGDLFNNISNKKLEIIFLENIAYLNLNDFQINKIIKGNFKNLLKTNTPNTQLTSIELEDPVVIVNKTIKNINVNNITSNNNIDIEDIWVTTEF